MFMLSLPANRKSEDACIINGKPATYRLHADRIDFRHGENEPWQSRKILHRQHIGGPDDLTCFVCDDGPKSRDSYFFTREVVAKDGTPTVETLRFEGGAKRDN